MISNEPALTSWSNESARSSKARFFHFRICFGYCPSYSDLAEMTFTLFSTMYWCVYGRNLWVRKNRKKAHIYELTSTHPSHAFVTMNVCPDLSASVIRASWRLAEKKPYHGLV